MKALDIALKDMKVFLRDRKALALTIAMPLILITILGLALGPLFQPKPSLPRFPIGVVDEDGQALAANLAGILESQESLLSVKRGTRREIADLVRKGELAAAVIIPEGFSAAIFSGAGSELVILADPGSPTRVAILRGLVEGFARQVSSGTIGTKTVISVLASGGALTPAEIAPLAQYLGPRIGLEAGRRIAVRTESLEAEQTLSGFQFYAVGMAVMFLLFAVSAGVKSILEERESMTLARLLSTPTSARAILWGKVSGTFAIGLFQLTSLIVLTSVIYRVDWGSSLSGLVSLTITTVFAATGLAVFVAALARTARTADLLSLIIVQISSLAGGSMFPLQAMPDFMKTVAKATVNGWAITGYTNLMGGGGLESILQPILALTVMGFVLVAIGAWRLSLE